jgi:hypothetical protein
MVAIHSAPTWGWTRHTASRGLTLEQTKEDLFNGRDLGKKDSLKRQLEYAERTARKAIGQSGT